MKIFLIILILQFLFASYQSGKIYCGLFGWVGNHPSAFNKHIFTILGMFNQDRGGDSSGIYTKKQGFYGTAGKSKFLDFLKEVRPLSVGQDKVILGHTRKASIGTASPENAQPIILKYNDQVLPSIVLTHNGTLVNHDELAKKYGIRTKELNTDSQVLASIIGSADPENRFKVLEEYYGTAALAMHFPETKETFLFKGESSYSSRAAYDSEERPLFYYAESKNSLYYSSMKEPLELIATDKTKIKPVPPNIVFLVKDGNLIEHTKIIRDAAAQRIDTSVTYAYSNWDHGYNVTVPERNMGGPPLGSSTTNFGTPKCLNQVDTPRESWEMHANKLYYNRGRYFLSGALANGIYTINSEGYVRDHNDITALEVGFVDGIMLEDSDDLIRVRAIINKSKAGLFNPDVMVEVLQYSTFPLVSGVTHNLNSDNNAYTLAYDKESTKLFGGFMRPYFSKYNIRCLNGKVDSVIKTPVMKLYHYKDISNKVIY